MKSYLYLCIAMLCFQAAFGQKSDKITLEQVAEKCKGLPISARIKLRIKEFRVKPDNCPKELGKEFKQSLTNGLQFVNCFTALNDETESNEKEGSNSIPLIVIGEVVHFMDSAMPLYPGEITIGIIVKVLNPQNGEVLFSQSITKAKKVIYGDLVPVRMSGKMLEYGKATEDIVILILDSLVNNQSEFRVYKN